MNGDYVFPLSEVVVAPPSVYLQYVRSKVTPSIAVSGQNCYMKDKGAFTGEIRSSLYMLCLCVSIVYTVHVLFLQSSDAVGYQLSMGYTGPL